MSDNTAPAPEPASPPTAPSQGGGKTGLVSIILAGVALLFAFLPILSWIAWIPALVAIILAAVTLVKKRAGRGLAIGALVVSPIAWLIALIVSISSIASGDGDTPESTPTPEVTASASAPSEPESPSPSPTPESEAQSIGNGDHLVGSDIAPGQYRAEVDPGLFELCTVSQEDSSGSLLSIRNANEGSVIITIQDVAGSVVSFSGCANIGLAADVLRVNPAVLTNGDWLVGAEIPAGQYRAEVEPGIIELCTISQDDATGSIMDINNANEGSVIFTVQDVPGTVASFSGCANIQKIS